MLKGLEGLVAKYLRFKPKLIVLFGSRARGDYTDSSDYDILVVSDELPGDPREAFDRLYDLDYPNVFPIGMSTSSFLRRLEKGSTFILEVLEDGKVLSADEDFLQEVMAKFKEVRRRFRREGRTWILVTRKFRGPAKLARKLTS